jgi:replication factor A1
LGRSLTHGERRLVEYLVGVSRKHGVAPSDLFGSIVEAWRLGQSSCDHLGVECRSKAGDGGVFLVVRGQDPLGQFYIPSRLLVGGDPLRELDLEASSRDRQVRATADGKIRLADLRAWMKEASVTARVVAISEPREVYTRFGEYAQVATATIEDGTGTAKLTLWNGQIRLISEGDVVDVENARVVVFHGEIQLSIGKRSRLSFVEDPGLL